MSRTSPLSLSVLLLGALVVVAPACGKRGPPLPPLHPAPDHVTDLTIVRRERDVTLRFSTTVRNQDGSEPLRFDRVEIYATTVAAGGVRPTPQDIVVPKNRLGELGKAAPAAAPAADAAVEPPVAVPLTFVEKVAIVPAPAPLLAAPPVSVPPAVAPPTTSTAAAGTAAPGASGAPTPPATLAVATRFYVIVPYANRTRVGAFSDVVAVPLGPVPLAPHGAAIAYDEQTLTLSWVAGAAGQSFHVYDAAAAAVDSAKPLTPTALTATEFKRPVVFGTRVCFAVRGVRTTGPVTMESSASNVVCTTPADTFAPPAPTGLTSFAATGAITLTWDAVAAADLVGYVVLRGEGTGDRLQPLMSAAVTGTSFTDSTPRPGVRYVYAVVAVDNATPANRSKESNRVEETGR